MGERGEMWECIPYGVKCRLGVPRSDNMGSGRKL